MKSCLDPFIDKDGWVAPPTPLLAPKTWIHRTCGKPGNRPPLSDAAIDNIAKFLAEPESLVFNEDWLRNSLRHDNKISKWEAYEHARKVIDIS